jgi:hypothetical protein
MRDVVETLRLDIGLAKSRTKDRVMSDANRVPYRSWLSCEDQRGIACLPFPNYYIGISLRMPIPTWRFHHRIQW